jgi:hypothetical protein
MRYVTKTLGLAFGAEKNVSFAASFACQTGEAPISIGPERQYLVMASPQWMRPMLLMTAAQLRGRGGH